MGSVLVLSLSAETFGMTSRLWAIKSRPTTVAADPSDLNDPMSLVQLPCERAPRHLRWLTPLMLHLAQKLKVGILQPLRQVRARMNGMITGSICVLTSLSVVDYLFWSPALWPVSLCLLYHPPQLQLHIYLVRFPV
jgi:hypothetical protein